MRRAGAALLALLFVARPAGTAAQAGSAEETARLLGQLRERWRTIPGLQAKITHTFEWVLAGETQTTRGTLELAGRDSVRIETGDVTIVSDGRSIWQYTPAQKQVVIDRVDPARGIVTPGQLFTAYTEDVTAHWVREERLGRLRMAVLHLERTGEADPRALDVWVDTRDLLVMRLEYRDGAGNNHRYLLDEVVVAPQDPARFTFLVPEGVTVVDLRPPGTPR
jgi:outer membrane lipoprotein-sorting protein